MHYICIVLSRKKHIHSFLLALTGCISLLAIQPVWMYHAYLLECKQMMSNIEDAFTLAYQKEQTYRVPVVDSMPLNIDCLAELFAGMLYDKDISIFFVLERFDVATGVVLETSLLPSHKQPKMIRESIIIPVISDKEAIRVVLYITPGTVFARMTGTLACTVCLTAVTLACIVFLYRFSRVKHNAKNDATPIVEVPVQLQDNTFYIGHYRFDSGKNELTGFGETIQLNKKENSILYALCIKRGNIVERNVLLEENWGNLGMVYSRSLDTYLTSLRKYLRKDPSLQIVTVKGVGYKLVANS